MGSIKCGILPWPLLWLLLVQLPYSKLASHLVCFLTSNASSTFMIQSPPPKCCTLPEIFSPSSSLLHLWWTFISTQCPEWTTNITLSKGSYATSPQSKLCFPTEFSQSTPHFFPWKTFIIVCHDTLVIIL